MDIINVIGNGHVPGINDTLSKMLEDVSQNQRLNIAMKVTKSLRIIINFPGMFTLEDHFGVWASQEQAFNGPMNVNCLSDKVINGEESKVLVQRKDNNGVFVPCCPVNDTSQVLILL